MSSSSLTRDRTQASCTGRVKSKSPDHQESPAFKALKLALKFSLFLLCFYIYFVYYKKQSPILLDSARVFLMKINYDKWASFSRQESDSHLVMSDSLSPMDCSPSGSSVPGTLQVRILELVAIPFCRGSSWSRVGIWVSCNTGGFFTIWATREAHDSLDRCPLLV